LGRPFHQLNAIAFNILEYPLIGGVKLLRAAAIFRFLSSRGPVWMPTPRCPAIGGPDLMMTGFLTQLQQFAGFF
jgi:hypothetical protein